MFFTLRKPRNGIGPHVNQMRKVSTRVGEIRTERTAKGQSDARLLELCIRGRGQRHDVENVEEKGKEDPEATKNHPRKVKGHRSNAAVLTKADCTRIKR